MPIRTHRNLRLTVRVFDAAVTATLWPEFLGLYWRALQPSAQQPDID
jgi:hypothetical protein